MHLLDGRPVYSATDLVGFLACEHLTDLERAALAGLVERPHQDDAELDLIRRRGEKHEQRFLAELVAAGRRVETINPDAYADAPDGSRDAYGERLRRQVEQTLAALRRGDDVIYQAAFFDGTWRGHADFLRKVTGPGASSTLGDYHYEVIDTKLAHKAKAGALIQMCSYVDLLTPHQGRPPEHMYVALGGVERPTERFRVADFFAYYRALKRRFEASVAELAAGGRPVDYPPSLSQPDPVEHCDVCRWIVVCKGVWRRTDHLSLVANISRSQRRSLTDVSVGTRRGLAAWPLPVAKLPRTNSQSLTRVREQARIQVEGEDAGDVRYELLEPERLDDGSLIPSRGLAALPAPSTGDLFFDIEGDPFAFDEGIEYLFGVVEPRLPTGDGGQAYHQLWARTKADEQKAFEDFIDFVFERRAADPNLHIYHYGSYERGRVARLSTRYATREEQVDVLLRSGTFVDLFNIVRQALRASVESYSIKRLEPLYGFVREVDLQLAGESIVEFERYLEEGGADESILARIADYNRDDCLSAWRLRDWLETRRPEAEARFGLSLPRPARDDGAASAEKSAERLEVQRMADRLTEGLPVPEQRTPEQRARQLLGDLLDWHWREDKSAWWRFFELLGKSDDELLEATEAVAGLEYVGPVALTGRQTSPVYRYKFPPQETKLDDDDPVSDPRLYDGTNFAEAGTIARIDASEGWLELKRPRNHPASHPTALVPRRSFSAPEQRRALLEIAGGILDHDLRGRGHFSAARDLLLRASPRAGQVGGGSLPDAEPGAALALAGEKGSEAALRIVLALDDTTLPIQGPPGSGKSTTGAEMILRLVDAGLKVGITANSHKVIGGLLEKVVEASRARKRPVRAVQKADAGQGLSHDLVTVVKTNEAVVDALRDGTALIAAGTAWLWARQDMREAVDVLFVDEAGQLSLANALAVSSGARSMVLLGDPQQLDQPTQGAHPGDAGKSALEHVIGGDQTMHPRRGLFFEHTFRLHPAVTRFTSELFYGGELESAAGLEGQRVHAPFDGEGLFGAAQRLHGSGLRFVPIEHVGNSSRSVEEAAAVAALVRPLADGTTEWTDQHGDRRPLTWEDVLIVAPYNAQVSEIRQRLPPAARDRVGTVDKFQGQQAVVAIYSMTTSSAEEAPHNMEFLYSLNRLNVATSRARCLAVVVANPALIRVHCKTPDQLRLANALCAFIEMAQVVSPPPVATGPR